MVDLRTVIVALYMMLSRYRRYILAHNGPRRGCREEKAGRGRHLIYREICTVKYAGKNLHIEGCHKGVVPRVMHRGLRL
jgi:hypothetical protein